MKLATKYLICLKLTPSNEWMHYLVVEHELDTEEEAIKLIDSFPKKIRYQYYIIETKRYE